VIRLICGLSIFPRFVQHGFRRRNRILSLCFCSECPNRWSCRQSTVDLPDVLMETTSVAFPEGATDADYRQRGHKISAHNAKLMGVPIKIPRKQSIGHHC
jgi:hypothetical protein